MIILYAIIIYTLIYWILYNFLRVVDCHKNSLVLRSFLEWEDVQERFPSEVQRGPRSPRLLTSFSRQILFSNLKLTVTVDTGQEFYRGRFGGVHSFVYTTKSRRFSGLPGTFVWHALGLFCRANLKNSEFCMYNQPKNVSKMIEVLIRNHVNLYILSRKNWNKAKNKSVRTKWKKGREMTSSCHLRWVFLTLPSFSLGEGLYKGGGGGVYIKNLGGGFLMPGVSKTGWGKGTK